MHELRIAIEHAPSSNAAKEVLEWVRYLDEKVIDAKIDACSLTILFKDTVGVDMETITARAHELVDTVTKSLSKDFVETLHASTHVPVFAEDPWSYLVNSGLVVQVQAGLCYLSGDLCELLESVDLLFRDYASSLGATFQSCTSMLPINAFIANGYLGNFPQHAFFVASAHQSLSALKSLSEIKSPATTPETELLGSIRYVLAPTVCYHSFEALRGSTIEGQKIVSARGMCHRNEAQKADSLTRLQIFNMREVTFLGDAAFVEAIRDRILQYCLTTFDSLRVKYRVQTASDPFFVSGAEQRRVFQKLSRSKLELQFYIPHSDSWVSVASFNHHANILADKYSIGPVGVNSGCFGVGYERLLYALICQLGCDIQEITRIIRRAA